MVTEWHTHRRLHTFLPGRKHAARNEHNSIYRRGTLDVEGITHCSKWFVGSFGFSFFSPVAITVCHLASHDQLAAVRMDLIARAQAKVHSPGGILSQT